MRLLTNADLLGLRDIGQPDASVFSQDSPLAISPDGKSLAFVLNRADPESNSYCRALLVVNTSGPGRPEPSIVAVSSSRRWRHKGACSGGSGLRRW
jgi:hypothetical protein